MPNGRSRSERRKERYALAERLEFTVEEKRRMRDLSDEKFNRLVVNAERRLRRIDPVDRSPNVQRRLRRLQDYRQERRQEPEKVRRITESRPVRVRNYSKWSKEKDFPPEMRRRIIRLNRAAGFGPNNSYGFRVFYHMYVNRVSEAVARERFERRDT